MSTTQEKLAQAGALKALAQKLGADFAAKEAVDALAQKADEAASRAAGIGNTMYRAPTCTQYRAEITPVSAGAGLVTGQTVGEILGDAVLAGLPSAGPDGAGNEQYDFVLNGVKIGSYTRHAILSDILEDINGNKAAAVSASYSEEANIFTFTARVAGGGVYIEIGAGLAAALFDPVAPGSMDGERFVGIYGIGWMDDGRTAEFTVGLPGMELTFEITKDTTLKDVIDNLNDSPMGMNHSFFCNKYTGQIEGKYKKTGVPLELTITDPYGDDVWVKESDDHPNPYTYGQDGIFTAVQVNGSMQKITNREVNIRVPDKVSDLVNDSGFQTAEEVGGAIKAGSSPVRMLLQSEYEELTDEEKRRGLFFICEGGFEEAAPEETPEEESASYAGEEDETLETELPEVEEEDSWAEEDEWAEDTAEDIIIIDSIRINGDLIGLRASNIDGLPSGSGFPSGGIIIWSGASGAVPSGWALCDGTKGTPDLRDRFVVGAGSTYAVGAKGGEAAHKLTVSEMPSHFHELGGERCVAEVYNTETNGPVWLANDNPPDAPDPKTDYTGGSQPHNNLPPYYALCYIMKL